MVTERLTVEPIGTIHSEHHEPKRTPVRADPLGLSNVRLVEYRGPG